MSEVLFECPNCETLGRVDYINTSNGRIICTCNDAPSNGFIVDDKVNLSLIQHLLYEVEDLKDEIRRLRNQ